MITDLRDYIVDKLENVTIEVSGVDTKVLAGNVYSYPVKEVEYPCAIVIFQGSEAEVHSTKTNERKYTFMVSLRYILSEEGYGISQAENDLYLLTDAVTDAFDKDRQANGEAMLLYPVIGNTDWLDSTQNTRYCDIELVFMEIRDVS